MSPAPRSPRPGPSMGELEIPSSRRLHGKEWHMGDPHISYRFTRVLGTGYYGVTYLCSSLSSGELVAIKALDKLHPEYERGLAVEEILILAAVSDHPNVAGMHEVWEDASYIYIVMEACLGGELFDMVIERKYFTEADAASITAAVLSVMQHCHSKGIIHRDLKPENFLLLREGELSADNLRAIDFGLSKFVEPDGICRSCVGSSYYVAPEVLKGAYSYEADAWSVGTIAYILLSGFPPFWGSSDQVIFHRILTKPVDFGYQPWHLISAEAKDFVGRLLEKDPHKRMTISEALMHPWITHKATDVPLSTEIISRLQSFTHQNRVKCLLMTIAAHHLSDDEIGGLRKIFHFIDADQDGEISMHDLTVALQHTGLNMEQQGVMTLLAGLDLDRHGAVSVEEFIAAALDERKVLNAKNVNTIFTELDRDHDGLVTVKELKDALEECHISIKQDTLGRLMEREGALDSKGMVSAKSFSELLMNGQSAQPLELESWVEDVHQFSASNGFKQLAMLVVARHMQPSEAASLRRLFQQLDHEATGTVSLGQLGEAMRHMGKEVGEAELQELIDALDVRDKGFIEYDQFLAACLEEQHLTETKLRAAFDFFDRDGTGLITQSDVVQVLKDVGMDEASAEELMAHAASASGAAAASSSPAAAAAASQPTSPGSSASSSRSISYDDFRRVLLNQPPGIITKALSRANSLTSPDGRGPSSSSSQPVSPSSSNQAEAHTKIPANPLLESALAGLKRSPAAGASVRFTSPQQQGGKPPLSPQQPLLQPQRLVLPLADTDFEADYGDYCLESPQQVGGKNSSARVNPGFEPPSPISLMPRYEPSSPVLARGIGSPPGQQQQQQQRSAYGIFRTSGSSSPMISLAPRRAPLSPMGGGRGLDSWGDARADEQAQQQQAQQAQQQRSPYGIYRTSGSSSPMISLAPRQAPPSPIGSTGLGSPGSARADGSGLTLQQILQHYSSSGYTRAGVAGSRRNSIDAPLAGGTVARESVLSQASDADDVSWLGSN